MFALLLKIVVLYIFNDSGFSPNENPQSMPPPPLREYKLDPTILLDISESIMVTSPPLIAIPPPPNASPSGI